ncbi:MAG: hypothetical protein QXK13_06490 [Fervidicoccaceae archaeon]
MSSRSLSKLSWNCFPTTVVVIADVFFSERLVAVTGEFVVVTG